MIKVEVLEQFKKTYSDENFRIRKVGTDEIYDEAYDLLTSEYEYEETDILIAENEDENRETDVMFNRIFKENKNQ